MVEACVTGDSRRQGQERACHRGKDEDPQEMNMAFLIQQMTESCKGRAQASCMMGGGEKPTAEHIVSS